MEAGHQESLFHLACATASLLPNSARRIIVSVDDEIINYGSNSPLLSFAVFCKIYLPSKTRKVVRNRSAKGHKKTAERRFLFNRIGAPSMGGDLNAHAHRALRKGINCRNRTHYER
jgi:hypothetical protein